MPPTSYSIEEKTVIDALSEYIPARHIAEFNQRLLENDALVCGSFCTNLVLRATSSNEYENYCNQNMTGDAANMDILVTNLLTDSCSDN